MASVADQLGKDWPITVAFGEQLAKIIANGDDPAGFADQGAGQLITREFQSQGEMEAYRQGLADNHGWFDYYELDSEETQKYNVLI